MEQPDFSKYTEDQLRQIALHIDRERFPERMAEVEQRLSMYEQQRNCAVPDAIEPGADRLRISSDLSRLSYSIFPIFWFGILGFFLILILNSKDSTTGIWVLLVGMFIFGILAQHKINGVLTVVEIAGDVLVAKRGDEEEIVRLVDVDRIEIVEAETMTVVVHLIRSGKFGATLEFVPAQEFSLKILKENFAVAELKRRVRLAKAPS